MENTTRICGKATKPASGLPCLEKRFMPKLWSGQRSPDFIRMTLLTQEQRCWEKETSYTDVSSHQEASRSKKNWDVLGHECNLISALSSGDLVSAGVPRSASSGCCSTHISFAARKGELGDSSLSLFTVTKEKRFKKKKENSLDVCSPTTAPWSAWN